MTGGKQEDNMSILNTILAEIASVLGYVEENSIEKFTDYLLAGKRIFVTGEGRCWREMSLMWELLALERWRGRLSRQAANEDWRYSSWRRKVHPHGSSLPQGFADESTGTGARH